jgi:hypothetical protein
MRVGHFIARWEIEPDLKELEPVRFVIVHKWKHFSVRNTPACGHPLVVAMPISATIAPDFSKE